MMNVYLFQPHYPWSQGNGLPPTYWLPYSVGAIWSYAMQNAELAENFCLKDLFIFRDPVDQVVNSLDNPKVCGFSCYFWNHRYCLELAKQIKIKFPDCIIIFGGPQTSSKMLKYEYINTLLLNEGELNFTDFLQDVLHGRKVQTFYQTKRLETLDNVPSPYLTGFFDKLLEKYPDHYWNAVIETNRGCPYQCTFCDWGSAIYSKVRKFLMEKIKAEINWATTHRVIFTATGDANFGIFKERDLEIAQEFVDAAARGSIRLANIQNAKAFPDWIFKIYKVTQHLSQGLTVSLQSLHPPTLEAIKRKNLKPEEFTRLMTMASDEGLYAYTELILGLPEETLESWKHGLTELLEMGQHNAVIVWLAIVLVNSEMGDPIYLQKYGIKTVPAVYNPGESMNEDPVVREIIDTVVETNTMPQQDMIDAYLYTWMVMQMHYHTKIAVNIAKDLRINHNVPYRTFYDTLLINLQNHATIKDHVTYVKSVMTEFMTTGTTSSEVDSVFAFHQVADNYIYEYRSEFDKILEDTAEELFNK